MFHSIDRNEIETWACSADADNILPLLISRLIRATSKKVTKIDIPYGSAVTIGGWDGIVLSNEEALNIPEGLSYWEMGTTNSSANNKANSDYNKRKEAIENGELSINPQECTYVMVIPRVWTDKDDWETQKNDVGFWKKVIAINSTDLANWIDECKSVFLWFITQLGRQTEGLMEYQQFWDEWSLYTDPKRTINFQPEVVLAGRDSKHKLLLIFLKTLLHLLGFKVQLLTSPLLLLSLQ